MRSLNTLLLAIAAIALMAMLPGCGSSRPAGDISDGSAAEAAAPLGVDGENRPYVGADKCIECHAGEDAVADYLVGKHVIHSTEISVANRADGCLSCHDPIGDGRRLEGLIDPANVPAAGLAAVTCEACHGAGGQHYSVGPIPIAKPDYDVCGKCHNTPAFSQTTASHADFPEASSILDNYKISPHFDSVDRDASLWGNSFPNDPICVKCHTDEGGRKYREVSTWAALATTLPVNDEANPIQCRTCHNAHNPGELLQVASDDASAEYNTCANCHQRHNAQVTSDPGTDDGASGDLIYHAKRWARVISSTHYDDPATMGKIEGYSMDPANEHVCRDCHNVHAANITKNEQWARSGHGGELLTVKEEAAATETDNSFAQVQAVRLAGAQSSWVADDWSDDAQATCQRCHTATGGKHFMDDSVAYQADMAKFIADPVTNQSPNDFSYLQEGAHELLFCWSCHTDNTGALRSQDEVKLVDRDNTIFATLPAKGKSTVCLGCHGGRANGSYLADQPLDKRLNDESIVHYLPAAALLFSAQSHSGYEFAGKNYLDKDYFAHNKIGLDSDTGAGPCASCHMAGGDHSLQTLGEEENKDGELEDIIKNQTLCNGCHLADTMTRAKLDAKKVGFAAAIELLRQYVENDTVTNKLGLNLNDSTDIKNALVTVNYYGAQQNYQLLAADPGAYVHNSIYAKRLIFDSIDWLQDGDLDGVLDLTGYTPVYDYLVTWPAGTDKPPITAMTRP